MRLNKNRALPLRQKKQLNFINRKPELRFRVCRYSTRYKIRKCIKKELKLQNKQVRAIMAENQNVKD